MRTLLCVCAALGIPLFISSCLAVSHNEAPVAPGAEDAGPVVAGEAAAEEPKPEAEDEEDKELKRAKLQRSLAVAREKIKRAQLALEHQSLASEAAMANAERAHQLADRKLAIFREQDAPLRLDQTRLSLQRAQDYAKEQEEELEQLEMMYSEDDLAEKTAEIVLERGRRRLERARRSLQLKARELDNQENHHLPLEQANLQKEVEEKLRELEEARRKVELDRLDKEIALMEAQAEVARLEDELAALDREDEDAEE